MKWKLETKAKIKSVKYKGQEFQAGSIGQMVISQMAQLGRWPYRRYVSWSDGHITDRSVGEMATSHIGRLFRFVPLPHVTLAFVPLTHVAPALVALPHVALAFFPLTRVALALDPTGR